MKNNISIFAILLSVLTTMPFSAFAALPQGAYFDEWMKDEFCADDSRLSGMSCSDDPVFSCQKYAEDFVENRSLFIHINKLLKKACSEDTTTLFSNIRHVVAFGSTVNSVTCEIGYTHPTSGSEQLLRCVKDPNFSQADYDKCMEKGCSYRMSGETKVSFGQITQSSAKYKCICADDATQSNTTPTPAPKPAPSKAGGAGQKRVATPPVKKDARTLANEQYAEDMRKPWQEYTAEGGDDELEAQEMTLPPEANTTAYAVADDEVEAQEMTLPPEANTQSRDAANAQYAEDMRQPWQEYEAQEMTLPAEANTDATAVTPATEKTKKGICTNVKAHQLMAKYVDGVCTVESCVVGYEVVDNACVKKTKPTNDAETEPTEKTKKGICTNVKAHQLMAKYVDGVCTVESCVVGYEVVDNACVKKTKPTNDAETEPTEKTKKGICTNVKAHQLMAKYVDGVCTVESCVVGYEVVDNACVKKTKPTNDTETEPTEKTKKGICTNVKAHQLMAKYVDGVCTVESCIVGYEVVDNACVKKTKPTNESEEQETEETTDKTKKGICTNIKEHHLLAKYVDGVCTVESCVVGYEVSEDKKSCVAKDKSAKVAEKEQKKLEKELETDMNVLHTEFMAVVKKLMRDCKSKSGTINSETYECEIAATPGAE